MPGYTWTQIAEYIEARLGRELGRVIRWLRNVRQGLGFDRILRADFGYWNGKDVSFSRGFSGCEVAGGIR